MDGDGDGDGGVDVDAGVGEECPNTTVRAMTHHYYSILHRPIKAHDIRQPMTVDAHAFIFAQFFIVF